LQPRGLASLVGKSPGLQYAGEEYLFHWKKSPGLSICTTSLERWRKADSSFPRMPDVAALFVPADYSEKFADFHHRNPSA
jgi:hypothetical protein